MSSTGQAVGHNGLESSPGDWGLDLNLGLVNPHMVDVQSERN